METKKIYRLGIKYIDSKEKVTESSKEIEVVDNGKSLCEKANSKIITKSSLSRIQSVFEDKHENINLYSHCYENDVTKVRASLIEEFFKRFKEKASYANRIDNAVSQFRWNLLDEKSKKKNTVS